jgi:hypothetical protein
VWLGCYRAVFLLYNFVKITTPELTSDQVSFEVYNTDLSMGTMPVALHASSGPPIALSLPTMFIGQDGKSKLAKRAKFTDEEKA